MCVFYYLFIFSFILPSVSGVNRPVCLRVLVCLRIFGSSPLCQFTPLKLPLSAGRAPGSDAAALVRAGCRRTGNGSTVSTRPSHWASFGKPRGQPETDRCWARAGGTCSPPGWWGRVPGARACRGGLEPCAPRREEGWRWEENSETLAEFLLS